MPRDPEIATIDRILKLLDALPDDAARDRVLRYVNDLRGTNSVGRSSNDGANGAAHDGTSELRR